MTNIDIYLDNKYSLNISVTINGESVSHKPDMNVIVDFERRTVMFSTHIADYNIIFDDIRIEHMAKKYINIKIKGSTKKMIK